MQSSANHNRRSVLCCSTYSMTIVDAVFLAWHLLCCAVLGCAVLCWARCPRLAFLFFCKTCRGGKSHLRPFSASIVLDCNKMSYVCVQRQKLDDSREQEEHIDCMCGVTSDTPAAQQYTGLWLQCDQCLSWLHGACVGYPKRAPKGAACHPASACHASNCCCSLLHAFRHTTSIYCAQEEEVPLLVLQ